MTFEASASGVVAYCGAMMRRLLQSRLWSGRLAAACATPPSPQLLWRHSFASCAPTVKMLINGELLESKASRFVDVSNPATGEVVARTPLCTPEELAAAVDGAAAAGASWRHVPLPVRPARRTKVPLHCDLTSLSLLRTLAATAGARARHVQAGRAGSGAHG